MAIHYLLYVHYVLFWTGIKRIPAEEGKPDEEKIIFNRIIQ